jgi:NADPH-dependent 2,4-dienoyl-CoA reductase/sulfur reductase-like enzyme
MAHYPYLILGGGMTAAAAVRGIREIDASGNIGIISKEKEKPYTRPLLSKSLWKDKKLDKLWQNVDFPSVDLLLGRTARSIHPEGHRVVDGDGTEYTYGKLLLAMGGKPRRLPFGGEDIVYFRTLQDYKDLRSAADQKKQFAIIGGGFIGSELASSLCDYGNNVQMFFPDRGISARVFPSDLSHFVTDYFREKGVDVRSEEEVVDVKKQADKMLVTTKGGETHEVDIVVAGIGITPNTQLAEAAGLTVENGIVVDEFLQTSSPDIYAAGDVASFLSPALNSRTRVEHEDNALTMGKLAGRAMAGDRAPYHHLPYFYSDLFDLGYEAVGDLRSDYQVIEDWIVPYRKGVLYYLLDGRVLGVLLWDVWEKVDAARELIKQPGPFTDLQLRGLLTV